MTDQTTNGADVAETAAIEQQFVIQKIYLKDVSFESPQTPEVFVAEEWSPEVNVQVANNARPLGEGVYETALTITATASQNNETIYLAEVQYAGIFTVVGFDDVSIQQVLGAYCPNLIQPYIRETISDLVMKGGFPQMVLQPINFDQLYAQHAQEQSVSAVTTRPQ
ncbi:MAG: protein-export chaperone SecB [Halothiobacillus sp.]|jgi:preprotein translocase subunit SecB|uniref:protein-export chaperone SecB n=1 Tax=Halothiobacillus sp. TaxID=1891311 RepID=UPI002AD40F28|nr:protein-export chaperone SecB [Halothiobacillus sp.]MDA3878687.1 protein-export chaperone SecB [Halothiobacillus sp.]